MTSVDAIPVAHTPPGGYGDVMPPPVLHGCREALADGAPDLRGMWKVVDARAGDAPLPDDHPVWRHVERIEQAGDRVVVTSSGVVHDMRADGDLAHGVHDVMAVDFSTPIAVAATFENGVLVLRPEGLPGVEIRRRRDGDQLVWDYHTMFTAAPRARLRTLRSSRASAMPR